MFTGIVIGGVAGLFVGAAYGKLILAKESALKTAIAAEFASIRKHVTDEIGKVLPKQAV